MTTEYKLSYTAQEIDERLGQIDDVVVCTSQSLTPEQQAQSRENIGAFAKSDVSQTTGDSEVVVMSQKATTKIIEGIPHNLKWDMGFVLGAVSSTGNFNAAGSGIATKDILSYPFEVEISTDFSVYELFICYYDQEGTFVRRQLYTVAVTLPAGENFRIWTRYIGNSYTPTTIQDDLLYALVVSSIKDPITREEVEGVYEQVYATLPPMDCIREIYLEGEIEKEIVVGQIRKNFYVTSTNTYNTTFYLAYADAPTTWIARYLATSSAPIEKFVTDTPVEITPYNGSNISGYAVLDYNTLDDGYSVQPKNKVNLERAKNLCLNPLIQDYLKGEYAGDGIISLNKDVEHLVIQASKSRSSRFNDTLVPLQFVHFTDVHGHKEEWKRIVNYINRYEDYIQFAIHSGDYAPTNLAALVDLYSIAKPNNRIIYNAVGNHDTYTAYNDDGTVAGIATPEAIYSAVFSDTEGWNATFGTGDYAGYYYKDFADSEIRMIVLDDQQWSDAQATWLSGVLDDAKSANLSVFTVSHMLSGDIVERMEVTFAPIDDNSAFSYKGGNLFENILVAFKSSGGKYICHLCGHNHFDDIGFTAGGILNIEAQCASATPADRQESERVEGTKSFDCFNVVSLDVNTNRLKIVRIGCNTNASLQSKNVLCYDYVAKKIIASY